MDNFQIGLNGKQCIGPCYPEKTSILHPITLQTIQIDANKPFCPTMIWIDPRDNKEKWVDICNKVDDTCKMSDEQLILNYILPVFGFTADTFLKTLYNIFSFENIYSLLKRKRADKCPFFS